MFASVTVWAALCTASIAAAQPLSPPEALAWLQRIANAARQLNYTGTFVYQHGDTVETSRIVHLVEGTNETEKLETLDGPRREVLRTHDLVYTYHPDDKSLRVERRRSGRSFPQLLPDQLTAIAEHYEIRRAEVERVGGVEAQALVLEPRDGLRYGHKFWADTNTGLLLKAKMIGDRNHTMELFAFTQLQIGGSISRDLLKPSFAIPQNVPAPAPGGEGTDTGWAIGNQPAGFHRVLEVRRMRQGSQSGPLVHIVLSDGLAAVSVFIEPVSSRNKGMADGRLIQQGATHIYTRVVGDQRVTVLGETPAHTVMQIANSLSPKSK
jgi:sigma-E factor negative regulatory protein RseB